MVLTPKRPSLSSPCLSGCAHICSTLRQGTGKHWVQGDGWAGLAELVSPGKETQEWVSLLAG